MYMNCIDLLWFHDVITGITMAKGCKGYRDWKCTDCLYPECFLYNMLSPRLSIWEIGFILIVGLEYWLNRHAACIIHRDFYLGTLDANTQFGLFNTARAAWTFCSFCMETSSWYSFAMGQDVSIQAWKMKSCRCEVMEEGKTMKDGEQVYRYYKLPMVRHGISIWDLQILQICEMLFLEYQHVELTWHVKV